MEIQGRKMLQELEVVDLGLVRNPLGYNHVASDWLEDGDETPYYLATDGDLYRETEDGREYVGSLSPVALERLK